MALGRHRDSTRALQIGFFALLTVCVAQVGWWYLDQVRFTGQTQDRLMTAYYTEVTFAQRLQATGMGDDVILKALPNLEIGPEGQLQVSPAIKDALIEARRRRLYRYRWEGGFFLFVLVAGMGVLWRSLQAYDELTRRQQTFMAAISHEFKSPLASLRLAVDSLARRPPSPERVERLTTRMGGDLDRLESMVENLLNTSRLEDGRFPIHPVELDLKEGVRSVVEGARPRGEAKGVTFEIDIPPALRVICDPLVLQTVVQNLIENAIKSVSQSGGGVIILRAEAQSGGMALLQVEDDGLGFHPEEAAKLFDKFYRPGDAMRRKGGGTGLGLYLVSGLVEQSGGWVRGESKGQGEGARFEVALPLAPKGSE